MKRHHKSTSATKKTTQGQLRIIGGSWRGQKLSFADVDGLRPTGDRIRETLFNWLAPVINGAHCLDLFAGSGALGFEALSRGAASATLIEKDQTAFTLLQQSQRQLQTTDTEIINADALQWLTNNAQAMSDKTFDVVFLDPPFAKDLLQPCCDLLQQHLLTQGTYIYIETDRQQPAPTTPADWHLLKEKTAGQVCYRLYHRD